jgi:spore maturation protein B
VMSVINHFIVPGIIGGIFLYGLCRGVNTFDAFLEGAAEGLHTAASIVPALICLLTAVAMFKASGALDVLSWAIAPLAEIVGFPREVIPLALLRPISGSGAMVLFNDILTTYGPDSFIGRVASVLEGSTETTFYTIAVYYGATRVTKTRHTLPSALSADLTGMLMSVVAVRLFLGS